MNFLDVRYRFDDPSQHGLGGSLRENPPSSDRARSHLLASAIKITPALFPDLAQGLLKLGESMMLRDEVDCFVIADPVIQAYCLPHQSAERERFTVVLSSALIERLRIDEIRFVIGHEVAHFLCGHWRYPSEDDNGTLGDRLAILRLMRAAEISADRIGMLACRSLEHACAAMIKVAAGLGEPHLRPDIPSLLGQFRELARGDGTESAIWTTHPIIPLRVRALCVTSERTCPRAPLVAARARALRGDAGERVLDRARATNAAGDEQRAPPLHVERGARPRARPRPCVPVLRGGEEHRE